MKPLKCRSWSGRIQSLTPPAITISIFAVLCLLIPWRAWAGVVVASCTDASLRAAMAGGGTVTFACDGTITVANPIYNSANTVVDATGRRIIISGGNRVQIFYVAANSTLALTHLTLVNGRSHDGANGVYIGPGNATPGGPGEAGGAILNMGSMSLRDCIVTNNKTGNGGTGYGDQRPGGLQTPGGDGGGGGGIYNAGTLIVSNCLIIGNSTGNGGVAGGVLTYYDKGVMEVPEEEFATLAR